LISVGFYYRVKRGFEGEFERKFGEVVSFLSSFKGFRGARLYRSVDDPSEYLIYSEWDDLESYKNFINSTAYRETVEYGKSIIEGRPTHKVFQQINT